MRSVFLIAVLAISAPIVGQEQPASPQHTSPQHTIVYQHDGHFAGWPANNGIWNWGDEIVVGFTLGYYKKNPTGGHDIDRDKPSTVRQARSLDGGETWEVEVPTYIDDEGN
ncbi:MAG: hypothetical protein AB7U20_15070, partial [Planctomycetaceae bacterium]